MSVTLTLSERPMAGDTIERCSLCPTNLPLTELYPHIAQHLEQLSLFVLSCHVDDTQESNQGSNISDQARDDQSSRFNDLTDASGASSTHNRVRGGEKADNLDEDTVPTVVGAEEDLYSLFLSLQDWTNVTDEAQMSNQPVESDPLLLDLQGKQSERLIIAGAWSEDAGSEVTNHEPDEFKNVDDVVDFMDAHMTTTVFRGEEQTFLPRPAFDRVTTKGMIRRLISQDSDLYLSSMNQDEFAAQILNNCRKMFAACIFSEIPLVAIKALMEDGLSDTKFPFSEHECPALKSKRKFRKVFLPNQSRFHTAFFDLGSVQELDPAIRLPIDFDEKRVLGRGSSGPVYSVRIHGAHHSFPQTQVRWFYIVMSELHH